MKRIITVLCLCLSTLLNGQTSYERQLKYWYLRDRLRHFIIPSESPLTDHGTFLVMTSRNRNWPGSHIFTPRADYGQENALFGKYIGVLATEYHLLHISGRDDEADAVNNELINALDAFERLDLCENNLDPPLPSVLDGFFIRHDVPEDETPVSNSFLINSQVNEDAGILLPSDRLYMNGSIRPVLFVNDDEEFTPTNESMSQDEAIFLLEGLALSFKFGSLEVQMIAQAHARNVLHRLYGYINPLVHMADWIIRDPYGLPIPPDKGGDCRPLSFGYWKIANDFFGFVGEFIPFPGSVEFWQLLFNGVSGDNAHMIAGIAAIGEGWGNFILHQTQYGIFNNTDQDGWDYYYLWLYKALWDRSWSLYDVDRIEDRLDEAPCEGPYFESFTNHAPNGWSSPDKWRYSFAQQYADIDVGNVGIYSGMDYMILHNLYYINNGDGLSPYRNYISANQNQEWPDGSSGTFDNPYSLGLFRAIITTDKLNSNPIAADVRYKAGINIKLMPGFHAEEGTHFLAKIEPMDYCSNRSLIPNSRKDYPKVNTLKEIVYTPDFKTTTSLNNQSLSSSIIQSSDQIVVHPNPSTGVYIVKSIENFDYYKVFSLSGEFIKEGIINNCIFSIDLSDEDPGLYLLILQRHDKVCKVKISLIH